MKWSNSERVLGLSDVKVVQKVSKVSIIAAKQ